MSRESPKKVDLNPRMVCNQSIIFLGFYAVSIVSSSGDGGGEVSRKRDVSIQQNSVIFDANKKCTHCNCLSSLANDSCDGCTSCLRQLGEPCTEREPCALEKGLFCKLTNEDSEGICRDATELGMACTVYNKTYGHGETFNLDCRTQCVCQNGTYGCSSLCPQEHIFPMECQHPRLVDVTNQCCREWMCDSRTVEEPPLCRPSFSTWSNCSSACGLGLSSRKSNFNTKCLPTIETRICQSRRCQDKYYITGHDGQQHHLRKGHECKATHRLSEPVFLRFGPCRSRKRYRPKYCGICPITGLNCQPTLSTTVNVEFICEGPGLSETTADLLPEYLEPGADFWIDEFPPKFDSDDSRLVTVLVQWVLKCRCRTDSNISNNQVQHNHNHNNNIDRDFRQQQELILHRVHRT
ncbi:hypothetical protein ABEB36_001819 [Hypothenemus hampei]|uniref:VWFC domain-containing protein n=1 Tax=Hypothenemus hampei TaxID=57062 RepID=A0ABD1FGU8_HYPHA